MTAVIIVSFGRVALMKQTLDTLFNSCYDLDKVTVTVVDNGSQPEMVALLTSYRDRIHNLVLLRENRGKPYAWNLGARIAQEECKALKSVSPKYFLFCDNDLDFKVGWHAALVTTYEEHKDLPLCVLSGLRWPRANLAGVKKGPTTQVNIVRFPPGCCLFISAEAFKANGLWDTKRLIRTVDTSYCRNSQRRGYRNASIHPTTMIEHTGRKDRTWHIQTGAPKLLP